MIKTDENKTKEVFISDIVNDLQDMSISYLKTMTLIINTFKKNAQHKFLDKNLIENWTNSFFILQSEGYDNWDTLSIAEQQDINAGLDDLKNRRFKDITEVLSKYE